MQILLSLWIRNLSINFTEPHIDVIIQMYIQFKMLIYHDPGLCPDVKNNMFWSTHKSYCDNFAVCQGAHIVTNVNVDMLWSTCKCWWDTIMLLWLRCFYDLHCPLCCYIQMLLWSRCKLWYIPILCVQMLLCSRCRCGDDNVDMIQMQTFIWFVDEI